MKKQFFAVLLIMGFVTGCEFFDTAGLSIVSYSPADSIVKAADLDAVAVTFSRVPQYTKAEQALTLTADGTSLVGEFYWSGRTMYFKPFQGWKNGLDYQIRLSATVEDSSGRSLQNDFVHEFSTRSESDRPTLVSSTPADGDVIDSLDTLRPQIRLEFSESMDGGSLSDSFQIIPSKDGYLTWDSDTKVFTFTLTEDLDLQTSYEISVSTEALDTQNNGLAEPWAASFFVGTESQPPELVSLTAENLTVATEDVLDDTGFTVNANWETHWPLVLTFSEAIDTATTNANITTTPAATWDESWNGNATVLTLTPSNLLEWNKTYTVNINTGIQDVKGNALARSWRYNFLTDGPKSKPPEIVAIMIYTDPADATQAVLPTPYSPISFASFNNPPGSTATGNTVVDVFLDLAEDAGADILSLAEHFLVSAGGLNSFIVLAAKESDAGFNPPNIGPAAFGPADPQLPYDTWVRFIVYVDNNDSSATGILKFTITGSFADDDGRKMGDDWVMPITVTD